MIPGGGLIQGCAKVVVANVSAYYLHIFMARVGHCVRHEADCVGERMLGRFKPNDSTRDFQGKPRDRYGLHNSCPLSLSITRVPRSNPGSRSRSTSRAAPAKRCFNSSGKSRRLPSSKYDKAFKVISGLKPGP